MRRHRVGSLYASLTVPALFLAARRLAGSTAARAALVFFVASPMLMVGAATEMAHTSCMMSLAWAFASLTATFEDDAPWWKHAGVSFWFGLAFLTRPTSALGIGLPLLVWWAARLWSSHRDWRRAIAAFAVPGVILAAVFFGVNAAQNGSPFLPSYVRMQSFMREVNYVNVGWSTKEPPTPLAQYLFGNGSFWRPFANTAIALVRLLYDLFATPLVLVLLGFAWSDRRARLAWMSVLCYLAVHFFIGDAGIDSFGPVHYFEASLPLLVLAGIGVANVDDCSKRWWPALPTAWPRAVVASLVLVTLLGFVPVRLRGVDAIASNVRIPLDAVRDAHISNAVVFSAGLFVPGQCIGQPWHFVYARPNNDPELRNDVLWLNHLGWEKDIALMRDFPGRTGYLMQWKGCRPSFMRLPGT